MKTLASPARPLMSWPRNRTDKAAPFLPMSRAEMTALGSDACDEVQPFLPSPMATAAAMYHTGVNPLRGVRRGGSDKVEAIKGLRRVMK